MGKSQEDWLNEELGSHESCGMYAETLLKTSLRVLNGEIAPGCQSAIFYIGVPNEIGKTVPIRIEVHGVRGKTGE